MSDAKNEEDSVGSTFHFSSQLVFSLALSHSLLFSVPAFVGTTFPRRLCLSPCVFPLIEKFNPVIKNVVAADDVKF